MEGKGTIFFEDPFWVGIFERSDEHGYAVARHVFGSEPSEAELYQFVLNEYQRLEFSPAGPQPPEAAGPDNFKRRQRQARRQMKAEGAGTWAQRALQAELERRKEIRSSQSKEERQAQAQLKFSQRQERKKRKHRGR